MQWPYPINWNYTLGGATVLLAVLVLWLGPTPRFWLDIATDEKGRYVPLRLFKAICYFCGLAQITVAVTLNFLSGPTAAPYSTAVGFELLLIGLFGQVVKEGSDFLGRKTRDGDGALTARPAGPPPAPAPELMPQAKEPPLAGFDDGPSGLAYTPSVSNTL